MALHLRFRHHHHHPPPAVHTHKIQEDAGTYFRAVNHLIWGNEWLSEYNHFFRSSTPPTLFIPYLCLLCRVFMFLRLERLRKILLKVSQSRRIKSASACLLSRQSDVAGRHTNCHEGRGAFHLHY